MSLHQLLIPLLRLAPGTCLAASQLVPAILHCHNTRPCLFGTDPPGNQADRMSLQIRQMLAKAREAKKDLLLQNQLFRKASTLPSFFV